MENSLWKASFIYLLCPTSHHYMIVIQKCTTINHFGDSGSLSGSSFYGYHGRHGGIKTLNNQRIASLNDNGSRGMCGSDGIGGKVVFHHRLTDLKLKQVRKALKSPYRARRLCFESKSLYVFIDYYFIISKLEVSIIISPFLHLELLDFPNWMPPRS